MLTADVIRKIFRGEVRVEAPRFGDYELRPTRTAAFRALRKIVDGEARIATPSEDHCSLLGEGVN